MQEKQYNRLNRVDNNYNVHCWVDLLFLIFPSMSLKW